MYPCVLYCKVEGISRKEEKKIPCELCQVRICYGTTFLCQNCAKCVLEVRSSHAVCGKTFFFLRADLSLFSFFFLFVQVALVLSCIKYQAKFVHIVSGGTQFLM